MLSFRSSSAADDQPTLKFMQPKTSLPQGQLASRPPQQRPTFVQTMMPVEQLPQEESEKTKDKENSNDKPAEKEELHEEEIGPVAPKKCKRDSEESGEPI